MRSGIGNTASDPVFTATVGAGGATMPAGTAGDPIFTTTATGSQIVVGNTPSGTTDSGAGVKGAGKYNLTPITLTDGQRGDIQVSAAGMLLSTLATSAGVALATTNNSANGIGTAGTLLSTAAFGRVSNGSSWDLTRKPNLFARVVSSAASGNPASLKASAGDVMQLWGQNGAAITYLQLYNKATAPTIGTDTPVLTYPIPANAVFAQTFPNGGAYFATGIAYAFTTDAAGTTGSASAAVTSFALLAA